MDVDKLNEQLKLDRIARELDISKAIDESIDLGKDISKRLEGYKPITRCLVAYILAKEYRRRFPRIMEHFDKVGIGDI